MARLADGSRDVDPSVLEGWAGSVARLLERLDRRERTDFKLVHGDTPARTFEARYEFVGEVIGSIERESGPTYSAEAFAWRARVEQARAAAAARGRFWRRLRP
jgi:hypothetical protein